MVLSVAEQNPRGNLPATYDPRLSEPLSPVSLVECMGEVADDIRQIATDLGARPYTIHAVRVRWSGGAVGRGEPSISSDIKVLPTPAISAISLDRDTDTAGAVERGDVTLTEVSPRYTEDEIDLMFGISGDPAEEAFIEQRIDSRDGQTKRRRFTIARPPERRGDMFDWKVYLRRYSGDRTTSGARRPVRQDRW